MGVGVGSGTESPSGALWGILGARGGGGGSNLGVLLAPLGRSVGNDGVGRGVTVGVGDGTGMAVAPTCGTIGVPLMVHGLSPTPTQMAMLRHSSAMSGALSTSGGLRLSPRRRLSA